MGDDAYYRALAAKDARFDGLFFVGVTSTGIYCRPVCTARTPRRENCRFFTSAEAAEKARFRPCLRCRPELAPGSAPIDDAGRIATALARRIEEGVPTEGRSLESIADEFELSGRQVRRIVNREFGVSPIELVQTRRLLLAKQLLTETPLPVAQVAFASGFLSLRRFNDAFTRRYGMPPSRLRRDTTVSRVDGDSLTLRLSYRPPFDWEVLLGFLGARAGTGVEVVTDASYARTLRIGEHSGWIRVRNEPASDVLVAEFAPSLLPVLPAVLGRVRGLFDLSARPDLIAAHFRDDPTIGSLVARRPGLRVPGAADSFELAVRAVLGQQVSVRSATAMYGRLASDFGDPGPTPIEGLYRLSPTAARLARAGAESIAASGIVSSRARTIQLLAREVAAGRLVLEPGADPSETVRLLQAIPGVGPWTSQYIAMRALRWPDAFPKEDVAVRKALGAVTPAVAEAMSQPWRPWRSYAAMQLWMDES